MVLRMASLFEQDTMGIPNRFNTLNSCSLNSVALEIDRFQCLQKKGQMKEQGEQTDKGQEQHEI